MRRSWLVGLALLLGVGASVVPAAGDAVPLRVGARVVPFKVVTDSGTLADYGRDYYGRQHLVLTFFAAAFTPV